MSIIRGGTGLITTQPFQNLKHLNNIKFTHESFQFINCFILFGFMLNFVWNSPELICTIFLEASRKRPHIFIDYSRYIYMPKKSFLEQLDALFGSLYFVVSFIMFIQRTEE